MTECFKAAFKGRWRDILQLSETAGAAVIAGDGIDILVVVAGHTEGNRPGIAAHRPAPVQVAIHDLTSTGLDTIDYWLTDVRLHPAPSHEIFSETLVRLPSLYLHAPPSEKSFEPRRGDGAGPVTFGSANNPAKLSGDVLGLWARILRDVPQSRLLLRYFDHFAFEDGREPIIEELARHGVSRERIQFDTGRRERVDQLRHLAAVDIALDPFPFNGATSTFEALWMGVPVVALAGQRFLGRVGAAHLGMLGLDNLVATSPDEYVRIAVALAQDPARRSELHRTIPERLRASPLCDAPAYARTIEAAFRKMWDAALAGTRWDGWLPGQ
jgi:predicted O-linked N-acetylglucosamine transferase (SPINDLY family)